MAGKIAFVQANLFYVFFYNQGHRFIRELCIAQLFIFFEGTEQGAELQLRSQNPLLYSVHGTDVRIGCVGDRNIIAASKLVAFRLRNEDNQSFRGKGQVLKLNIDKL